VDPSAHFGGVGQIMVQFWQTGQQSPATTSEPGGHNKGGQLEGLHVLGAVVVPGRAVIPTQLGQQEFGSVDTTSPASQRGVARGRQAAEQS